MAKHKLTKTNTDQTVGNLDVENVVTSADSTEGQPVEVSSSMKEVTRRSEARAPLMLGLASTYGPR